MGLTSDGTIPILWQLWISHPRRLNRIGRNGCEVTAMSSERTRSFPTTMMSPITPMVKVRRVMVDVKVRIGVAVDVDEMTRIALREAAMKCGAATLSPCST